MHFVAIYRAISHIALPSFFAVNGNLSLCKKGDVVEEVQKAESNESSIGKKSKKTIRNSQETKDFKKTALTIIHKIWLDRKVPQLVGLSVCFFVLIAIMIFIGRVLPEFISIPIAVLLILVSACSLVGIPIRAVYRYVNKRP